jgi:protease-4
VENPHDYAPPPARNPERPPAPAKKSRAGLILALVALSGFFLVALLFGLAFYSLLKMPEAAARRSSLTERTVSGSGKTRIARIDVSGVILEGDSLMFSSSVATADLVIEKLRTAAADRTVEAVLMRVDSPGGGVTASDRIHREVAKLGKKKKVAVLMGDRATSGGYYVSVAAHRIFAHPTTVTGSIGVIMTTLNVHEAAKELGIRSVVIKSAERKDLLSPFKPPEEIEQDKLVFQKVVMHLYERFTQLVSEGRSLPLERVKELADGSVYDAQTAVDNKLIDAIAYEDEVLDWLKGELKEEDVTLFEYVKPGGFFQRLFTESRLGGPQPFRPEQIFPWWSLRSQPAYLWLPGI